MVSFILVRHGESKDNLRQVWAGWRDSPLSNHGMRQAEALGDYFAKTNVLIDAIYTSDLLRAKTTAKAVRDRQTNAEIPLHELHLLREQHFGAGEGMKFSKKENNLSVVAHYAKGKFPALHTRQQKFPGGESLDELAERAENMIDDVIIPEVLKEQQEGRSRTVVMFSHGIFIAELVASIIKRDGQNQSNVNPRDLRGMHNTGCTRLDVTLKMCEEPGKPGLTKSSTAFSVKLRGINRHAHLSDLHRQKGGIGSLAHDPMQQDIRTFLGNKQKSTKPATASGTSPMHMGSRIKFKPY